MAEEKVRMERLTQEDWLQQTARQQREELTAVGHELDEWEEIGDLVLHATCSRCKGIVTISAGKVNLAGYVPLMKDDECPADEPARMIAVQKEWDRRLAKVYALLVAQGRERLQRQKATSDE